MVEVDSSFYALPTFNNSVLWTQRTPEEFVFDVKLFRAFTLHQTPLKALPKDLREQAEGLANKSGNVYYDDLPEELRGRLWQMFLEAVEPLKAAGKLGYLLLQLPPWGVKNRDNVKHVEECLQRLDGYQVAIEFRNATWLSDRSRASTDRHAAGDERSHGDRRRAAGLCQQHAAGLGSDIERPCSRPLPRPQRRDVDEEGAVDLGAAVQLPLLRGGVKGLR